MEIFSESQVTEKFVQVSIWLVLIDKVIVGAEGQSFFSNSEISEYVSAGDNKLTIVLSWIDGTRRLLNVTSWVGSLH